MSKAEDEAAALRREVARLTEELGLLHAEMKAQAERSGINRRMNELSFNERKTEAQLAAQARFDGSSRRGRELQHLELSSSSFSPAGPSSMPSTPVNSGALVAHVESSAVNVKSRSGSRCSNRTTIRERPPWT